MAEITLTVMFTASFSSLIRQFAASAYLLMYALSLYSFPC